MFIYSIFRPASGGHLSCGVRPPIVISGCSSQQRRARCWHLKWPLCRCVNRLSSAQTAQIEQALKRKPITGSSRLAGRRGAGISAAVSIGAQTTGAPAARGCRTRHQRSDRRRPSAGVCCSGHAMKHGLWHRRPAERVATASRAVMARHPNRAASPDRAAHTVRMAPSAAAPSASNRATG